MLSEHKQRPLLILLSVFGLILLLVYMQGGFEHKVSPGQVALKPTVQPGLETAVVAKKTVQDQLSWPGTVQSRTITHVAPRISARVLDIMVNAGDKVKRGDVLAKLDNQAALDRENQALAALAGATAQAEHAKIDERRIRNLFIKEAATRDNFDTVQAQLKQSQAAVNQTRSALDEARAHKDDAVIRAPFDGIVVKRLQEPGNMAMPGVPVITLQSQQGLRLEAPVPARCASHFSIGMAVNVRIDNPAISTSGRVDEIVPEVDPQTRSQLIKVVLPELPGIQSGSFGWLEQSCDGHESLLIPSSAVMHIGQLEVVKILSEGQIGLRHIRTAKTIADQIEVLSGLHAGETVLTNPEQVQ